MFKSITCTEFRYNPARYLFTLIDSEFACVVSVRAVDFNTSPVAALVQEYGKRNLPIVKNIGIYYFNSYAIYIDTLRRKFPFAAVQLNMLAVDKVYPEIEFNKKYLRCVINQLKVQLYCHNVSIY